MIFVIADNNVACGGNGDALERVKLATASTADGFEEGALRTEDLYSVVAGVGDDNIALVIHSDATRKLELALVRALGAEERQHAAVDIEYLHAMIFSVTDDHPVRVAHRDVVRPL